MKGGFLREKLEEHLGRKLSSVPRRTRMAADGIPTIQDLGFVLPEMAMIMLKRYHRDAPATRRCRARPAATAAAKSDRSEPGGSG